MSAIAQMAPVSAEKLVRDAWASLELAVTIYLPCYAARDPMMVSRITAARDALRQLLDAQP